MNLVSIKCPYCQHDGVPLVEKRISAAGWALFVALLIVCFPLCWIPLVAEGLKENVVRCANCGLQLGC